MFPLPPAPQRGFLAASPTAAAPPAARLGPGPLPRSPAAAAGPSPTEPEVRVAVRQGPAEKRDARGVLLSTEVFTRLTGAASGGPGLRTRGC